MSRQARVVCRPNLDRLGGGLIIMGDGSWLEIEMGSAPLAKAASPIIEILPIFQMERGHKGRSVRDQ